MHVLTCEQRLSPIAFIQLVKSGAPIQLGDDVKARVRESRAQLDAFVDQGRVIYGVNTSMGGFVNWLVPEHLAQQLQLNLINAVATNVGHYLDACDTRAAMLARIVSLCRGYSAVSLETLQVLVDVYNSGILPRLPAKGSLGTSGDLGPLACIALVCVGQWKALYQGREHDGAEALRLAGITPAELSYKEGLCLINGTSVMTGIACRLIEETRELLQQYCLISALSFEGLLAVKKPLEPAVQALKPHAGQMQVAASILGHLQGSGLAVDEAEREAALQKQAGAAVVSGNQPIEDAYSLRCTPQVLGPVLDTLAFVERIVGTELNSSNDNPLVIAGEQEVYHNGHFHGQYIAMCMDYLSIALTTLCNLSNRRIDRFLDKSHSNGLPPFLCAANPGLRLGLMGGQFMSASVTAENRSLCTPLSIQSLSTTGDFQDIVSFGLVAARRAREILDNTRYVIAFETICAGQAADIRGADRLAPATAQLHERLRELVPFVETDQVLTPYLEAVATRLLGRSPAAH